MHMKKVSELLFICGVGGTIYYLIENLFRGFSHWSMFVLGGICFLYFGWQSRCNDPMWIQVLRCTLFVICGEFITGMIVNKWLEWAVWDYSNQPYNLYGQICLPFAVFFSGLSVLGIVLSSILMHWIYGEEKLKIHIL